MRKALTCLLFLVSISIPLRAGTHLQKLNQSFPFGLLTVDYGILDRLDLKINTCIAKPTPFSKNDKISPYPYWQCFEVKNSRMDCERGKYDPHEEALMSMLVLVGERDGERHEFISRRPISLNSCKLYQKDWQKFTRQEKYVCVSGADHSMEIQDGKRVWIWIFGRYKTKKGCDSYFADECNSTKRCEASSAGN